MKDVELKLLIELIKNSRRSDKELAKAVGTSQPTVSRLRKKMEKEGYIREYTIIPDFTKLGFRIMTIFLARLRSTYTRDVIERNRGKVHQQIDENPEAILMAMSGIGINSDRVMILLSKDFVSHNDQMNFIKQNPLVDVENVNSFMIDLSDQSHFMPLTLTRVAKNLEKELAKKESKT